MKSSNNAGRLAWLLLAVSAGLFGLVLALESTACQFLFVPSDPRPATAYGIVMVPLNSLAFSLMGALVVNQRPGNNYGWLMLLFGLGINLFTLTNAYGTCGLLGHEALPYGATALWLDELISSLIFFTGLFLLQALYPTGRFLSPRWRRFGLVLLIFNLLLAATGAFIPGTIGETSSVVTTDNPFGVEQLGDPLLKTAVNGGNTVLAVLVLLTGIASLLLRYRRAVGVTRLQIKWFLFFTASFGLLFIVVEVIGTTIYPPIFDGWFYLIELAIFWIGLPLVIGFAILRYRLFDIDIIIRRTLVYGLLTAVLIAVYFGVVLLAQSLFVSLTGQESPIAIVISTLVIASLFNPLRQRIQAFIDRRFYRSSYDATLTLAHFAQSVRDEVELPALLETLSTTIQETMKPETFGLWLAPESTTAPESEAIQGGTD